MASVNVENLLIEKQKKKSFKLTIAPDVFTTISDWEQIVTEDDEPVDNMFSAKQQRLLVAPLYSSWQPGRPFVADANVGLFGSLHKSPIVPDMFLSMDVQVAEEWGEKKHRSYFVEVFGKPPELVVEIISNRKGNEGNKKFLKYALIGVKYYVLYDPFRNIQNEELKLFELRDGTYKLKMDNCLDELNLSLILWTGFFENKHTQWLRWCNIEGELIPTGAESSIYERKRAERERERAEWAEERVEQERERAEWAEERAEQERECTEQAQERAEQERERAEWAEERAEQERERAEQAQERAKKLAAQLRALGVEPK